MIANTNSIARQGDYRYMGQPGFSHPEVRIKIVLLFTGITICLFPVTFVLSQLVFRLAISGPLSVISGMFFGAIGAVVLSLAITKVIAAQLNAHRSIRFVITQLRGELNAPRDRSGGTVEHETPMEISSAVPGTAHLTTTTNLWEN